MANPKALPNEAWVSIWNSGIAKGKPLSDIAADMGVVERSLYSRRRRLMKAGYDLLDPHADRPDVDEQKRFGLPRGMEGNELVEEVMRRRQPHVEFAQAQRDPISISLTDDKPVGMVHFGDLHLDDDGTDLYKLKNDISFVKDTPGLYASFLGDTNNSWVGRLGRLYAAQRTTEDEGWLLAEWFFEEVAKDLICTVSGNHDQWNQGIDPVHHLIKLHNKRCCYGLDQVILNILCDGRDFSMIFRHSFRGHSDWNDVHAQLKRLITRVRYHMAIGGHFHISSHHEVKDEDSKIVMHALQVASYKIHDSYAMKGDFKDHHISPSATTIFNTHREETHPDFLKLFWDPEEGAQYLTWLRSLKGRSKKS